jgi:hypothetical protein
VIILRCHATAPAIWCETGVLLDIGLTCWLIEGAAKGEHIQGNGKHYERSGDVALAMPQFWGCTISVVKRSGSTASWNALATKAVLTWGSRQGRRKQVIAGLQRALAMDPNHEHSRAALRRLGAAT